jgi:hypothetical protein
MITALIITIVILLAVIFRLMIAVSELKKDNLNLERYACRCQNPNPLKPGADLPIR